MCPPAFLREVLPGRPDLSQLQYGVLALGDRNFKRYCAFGRALDSWLHEYGATRMFGAIEVDNGDATALRLWRAQLASLIEEPDALSAAPAQESLRFEPWILAGREHLNPGSPGGALYRITLRPPGAAMTGWQPGDIAQLFPGSWSAIPAAEQLGPALREYSIASLPTDRQIELLVRQVRRADGSGGVGSGWLIRGAAFGAEVPLRIRSNRAFHPPALQLPLILIGNGTGLAGLRAHLKWRALHGAGRSWLLFGERSRQHDGLLDDELQQWRHSGLIEVLERVFSREGEACRYVQDALRLQATRLREWLAAGAAIYVCGSAEGMAQGVDLTLRDLLGAEAVDELMIGGRYRRDVY